MIAASVDLAAIADSQWHYKCYDLYQAVRRTVTTPYSASSLILYQVSFSFFTFIIHFEICNQ